MSLMGPEPKPVWKLRDAETGEVVFESDDPQTFVDRAHELEVEHKHRGLDSALRGIPGGTFSIEGDPIKLGVAGYRTSDGKKVGRKKLRTPSHLPDRDW